MNCNINRTASLTRSIRQTADGEMPKRTAAYTINTGTVHLNRCPDKPKLKIFMSLNIYVHADGYFMGDFQFRVLSGKALRENTTRAQRGVEIFPANPGPALPDKTDTELSLPVEISVK
jgi:hypothetical protein